MKDTHVIVGAKGSAEIKQVEVKLSVDGLYSQFNFLLGRLKTIVDATISAPAQNKALKDLIAQDVWHRYNYILELAGDSSKNSIGGKVINDGEHQIA